MKFFAWISMSILVALIISLPLVAAGMSKESVGILSLVGGAILLFARRGPPQ